MTPNEQRVAAAYRRIGPTLYARCRRILGDAAAAEDATQEVFLRVWRHAERAPAGDSVWPWMLRIASNYCLNVVRDAKATVQVETLPEAASEHPEEGLAQVELARMILSRSKPRVREVAVLYAAGVTQGEIASELCVSRRTVIHRMNAFRRSAARALAAT